MTPTLANLLLRETYRPHTRLAEFSTRSPADVRAALLRARRFVLDDAMSALLADLSCVPLESVAHERRPQIVDSLRHGARLPFPTTWIEFSGPAFRRRLLEVSSSHQDLFGNQMAPPSETPPTWGWLMEEHPQVPQAVRVSEYLPHGERVYSLPFHWVWQTTDAPLLPWAADTRASELALGIQGYYCPQVGVVYERPIPEELQVEVQHSPAEGGVRYAAHNLVVEMAGVVRYAMALLATLNDIPAVMTEVKQNRGFVARGNYRKYLDHTTVRLTVPARTDPRRLARRLIAIARRRAHEVRGHWRLYLRGAAAPCSDHAHAWGATDAGGHARCLKCTAWRTWIAPHQRGDASLGFVTHNYAVARGSTHRRADQ